MIGSGSRSWSMVLVVTVMGLASGESQSVSPLNNWYSGSCEPCPLCQSLLSKTTEVQWQQPLCVDSESSCTRCFSDLDVLSDSPPVGKRIVDEALQLKSCGRVPLFLLSQFLTVVPEAESSDPAAFDMVL